MSDKESVLGSEGEHNMKVLEDEWRYGANLHIDEEDEFLLDNKKIYTPLRLLVKKKVINPDRMRLPITLKDRLAFFRAYCSSPHKTFFVCRRASAVHVLICMGVLVNTVVTCLAMYFIQIFIAVFATKHHLYVMKMVPLAWGICVMYLFSAILDLTRFTDIILIFLDYFIAGLYLRIPWNTCDYSRNNETTFVTYENTSYQYQCMSLQNFMDATRNASAAILISRNYFSCYISNETNTCNQLSQVAFMNKRAQESHSNYFIVLMYVVVIWGSCALYHKQLYRNFLFKVLYIAQFVFNLYYFVFFVYVRFVSPIQVVPLKRIIGSEPDFRKENFLWELTQFLVGSLTFSPPILHFLTSRCDKIKPSSQSFFMTLGNTLLVLFRAATNGVVLRHVDSLLGGFPVELPMASCFIYPCLYYWFIFFESLQLGNFYSLLFLFINIMQEYITMVITFQCVVEIYAAEFKFAKRWLTTSAIFTLGLLIQMLLYNERRILCVLSKIIILFLECIAIFAIYPLGRLLDDLTFYYGVHPSRMRYLNILCIPATELLIAISVALHVHLDLQRAAVSQLKVSSLLLLGMALPFLGGAAYTMIKYLYWKHKKWTQIFCPLQVWGPDNFIARQLRKQFDSHEFIESQAPRILSRYLMRNAEPEAYKLDIVYEDSSLRPALSDHYDLKKIE